MILSRGEAHFDVTKGPGRPFLVQAGTVTVRAVGTRFSVDLGATAVEVLVTEGRVAIESAPPGSDVSPPELLAFVDAGNRAVVERPAPTATAPVPQISPVTPPQVAAQLVWRAPRLEFSGTPLGAAIPMLNANSRVRLILADPSLEKVLRSGILRADNTETLLKLLEEGHGIRAERRGATEIVLHPRRAP